MKTKLTRDELYKLLDYASSKQLVILMWWEIFNTKKIKKFYKCLEDGMSFYAAYKEAKKLKR